MGIGSKKSLMIDINNNKLFMEKFKTDAGISFFNHFLFKKQF